MQHLGRALSGWVVTGNLSNMNEWNNNSVVLKGQMQSIINTHTHLVGNRKWCSGQKGTNNGREHVQTSKLKKSYYIRKYIIITNK